MEVKDMTEQQVKEKIEALMRKHNVQDVYINKWVTNPFDISRGIDITVDSSYTEFSEDICNELSDYDNDICSSAGFIPEMNNPLRTRILSNMRLLYKDGKCLC